MLHGRIYMGACAVNPITYQRVCVCVMVVYRIEYYVPVTLHGRIYMGACAVNPITHQSRCACFMVVSTWVPVLLTPLRTIAFVYVSWSYILSNITYQSRSMVVSTWVPVLLTPLRTKAFVHVSWSHLHGCL